MDLLQRLEKNEVILDTNLVLKYTRIYFPIFVQHIKRYHKRF